MTWGVVRKRAVTMVAATSRMALGEMLGKHTDAPFKNLPQAPG